VIHQTIPADEIDTCSTTSAFHRGINGLQRRVAVTLPTGHLIALKPKHGSHTAYAEGSCEPSSAHGFRI